MARLVLKPNRGYGGDGVLMGPTVDDHAWSAALDQALVDPDDNWVAQELAPLPRVRQPEVAADGGARGDQDYYVVLGFAPSKYGLGVAVRVSRCEVVNVAQQGGLCALMVVQG